MLNARTFKRLGQDPLHLVSPVRSWESIPLNYMHYTPAGRKCLLTYSQCCRFGIHEVTKSSSLVYPVIWATERQQSVQLLVLCVKLVWLNHGPGEGFDCTAFLVIYFSVLK